MNIDYSQFKFIEIYYDNAIGKWTALSSGHLADFDSEKEALIWAIKALESGFNTLLGIIETEEGRCIID